MRSVMIYDTCDEIKVFIFDGVDHSALNGVYLGTVFIEPRGVEEQLATQLHDLIFKEAEEGLDYAVKPVETPIKLQEGDILVVCGEVF